jgi:hypothetical protein
VSSYDTRFELRKRRVMQIPREQVLEFVSKGLGDRLAAAQEELPAYVDTDRDARLLDTLGIDPVALRCQFNGNGVGE